MKLPFPVTITPPPYSDGTGKVTQPEPIVLDTLNITYMDTPSSKSLSARIDRIPTNLILYSGEEYTSAGDWTQQQAELRVLEVLGSDPAAKLRSLFPKTMEEDPNGPGTVLSKMIKSLGIVMSDNAKQVWEHELGNKDYNKYSFKFYDKMDFNAPFASGSARFNTMIICPCSMGTLARIATGISNDLITRAADVILKERRKLILVTRDTPLSLIHINAPATPSFYSMPKTIEDVANTVTHRILDLAGFNISSYRWNEQ